MTETVVTIDRNPSSGQPKSPPAGVQQTTSGGDNLNWIKLNINYFKSIPGIIKIIQLILGILCMSCASPARTGATHYFLFVAVTSFIATLLWSFAYFLGIREVLNLAINWILTELLNTGLEAILYTIAFISQLSTWAGYPTSWPGFGGNIIAGVFGILNSLAYAAGTYFLYIEHKSSTMQ